MIIKIMPGIWGSVLVVLNCLTPFLHSWRTKWGTTPEEIQINLPGDEYIPNPIWSYTHAVTINASSQAIWPWIVQMGQGRGGFYTYEFLENLVGCKIHNTDKIIAKYQELKVGDGVKLHPQAPPLPVVAVEADKFLLLHAQMDSKTGGPSEPGIPQDQLIDTTWLFYLNPINKYSTRLITRGHYSFKPTILNRLLMGKLFLEPISFVMERKMLLEIKRLSSRK